MSQQKGRDAEARALTYLQHQGLQLIRQNYQCRLGEIDLIMHDRHHLIFVEVRARTSIYFGGGGASINLAKKQKILKTALHFLSAHKPYQQFASRFDVISIDGVAEVITWLKDAFGTDY